MRYFCAFLLVALASCSSQLAKATPPSHGENPAIEARVQSLMQQMTLEEKVYLLGGDKSAFSTNPIPRLGIPAIKMSDGPLGVRMGEATAFPSAVAMAASWNPDLVGEVARAMGRETLALGRDMLLGPCIGLARTPFGGRNFESFGEDPYLTSQYAEEYVRGLQGEGVLASTKHFAVNDQEVNRFTVNTIVDERTAHELHLPAFQAAVNAGTWSVMASYNKVNGHWASENKSLLTNLLKNRWGFDGFVVSDWEATHSTAKAANAGLDLEMPTALFFGQPLLDAVRNGEVPEARINDSVTRILRAMASTGLLDRKDSDRPTMSEVGSAAHLALAHKAAAEGLVLLKNTGGKRGGGILPLRASELKRIALIGPGATHSRIQGGGSSMVNPTRNISYYDALRRALPSVNISHENGVEMSGDFDAIPSDLWTVHADSGAHGLKGEYFANPNLEGKPSFVRIDPTIDFDWGWNPPGNGPGMGMDFFSVRWVGYLHPQKTGEVKFAVRSDDGSRLYIDDKLIYDDWTTHGEKVAHVPFHLEAGKTYKVRMEYFEAKESAVVGLGFAPKKRSSPGDAVALAAKSDLAIVFVGSSRYYESEAQDRDRFELPEGQDELIRSVAAANPNTIVVVTGGNPVPMHWLDQVKGVIYAWFPGQEGSAALTNALLGKANFSGKLPVTFPQRWEDAPAFGHYPFDPGQTDQVTYTEGLYLGYRFYDSKNVEPLFPFGYGLSYTTFGYNDLRVQMDGHQASVEFSVTNTGKVMGAEVAQLYVAPQSPRIDRPFQELKGFERVELQPGETKQVRLRLDSRAFAYYDVTAHDWRVDAGQYQIRVGGSSRAIQLEQAVSLE